MSGVSVVIPTRNRSAVALETVRAVLAQNFPEFEVIVVDQSDTKPTELVELAGSDARVRVLRSDPPGTTRARNAGVRAAKGDPIVFLDDDAVPLGSGYLRAITRALEDPSVVGIAGRVLEVRDPHAMQGPILRLSRWGAVFPNASGTEPCDVDHARGGNMAFRRSVIERAGGFDERFRGNAMREETDFSLRARRFGRIRFVPDAVVEHRRVPTGGSRTVEDRIRWYEDFFFNEALFFGLHFPRWKRSALVLRKLRPILACAFYYGRLRPRAIRAPFRGFREGFRAAEGMRS